MFSITSCVITTLKFEEYRIELDAIRRFNSNRDLACERSRENVKKWYNDAFEKKKQKEYGIRGIDSWGYRFYHDHISQPSPYYHSMPKKESIILR